MVEGRPTCAAILVHLEGPGFFKLAASRTIFKLRCHVTGDSGERGHRPTQLVSLLAHADGILLS